jgi:tetratricopeptide (TPR) repeat protein
MELKVAVEDLAVAVEQDPGFAEAWVYLAAAQYVSPGYEKDVIVAEANAAAAASLEHAGRLVPDHPMVHALQGELLADAGDLVGALERLAGAARLSTQDSTPLMWLGVLLLHTGYVDEAIATLERAERMDPLVGISIGNLAIAYLSAGQRERAETKAQAALELGWPSALYIVSLDLAASGERERAVRPLVRSLELLARDTLSLLSPLLAAIRDPSKVDAYWVVKSSLPGRPDPPEESIGMGRVDILLDYLERESDAERVFWTTAWWLRGAWLPSTAALREDRRFLVIAEDLGMLRLWETRGYPPGCKRVSAPAGDHLDCAGMRR